MDSPRNVKRPDWQTLRELYDRRAETYRSASEHGPRVLSRKHQGIISHLLFTPGSRVLDAGCGDGVYCEWLSRERRISVVGIDISTEMLTIARRNVAHRGKASLTYFSACSLQRLPFADASFDGAVCSQVVEHLLDDRAGLNELSRILRPGGQLVISTDNHNNYITRGMAAPVLAIRALLRRRRWRFPFPHRDYRLAEFIALLSEAGFQVKRAATYRFSLPHSLSSALRLRRVLDVIETRLIRLPGVRGWGDIIVVAARKPQAS